MTTWIEALKIWNGKREGKKYMIPRKGTEEHSQVMSIMKGQQNGKGITFSKTKIKTIKPEDNIGIDIEQRMEAERRQLRRENLEKQKKDTGNVIARPPKKLLQQKGRGLVQLGRKAPKKKGGEIINPNIDLISEINDLWTGLIGLGLNQTQKKRLKKRIEGGMIDPRDLSVVSRMSRDLTKRAKQKGGLGWSELSAVNEVLYPLQPKLPSLDTKTGKPVPPSTPFDFLNITF